MVQAQPSHWNAIYDLLQLDDDGVIGLAMGLALVPLCSVDRSTVSKEP